MAHAQRSLNPVVILSNKNNLLFYCLMMWRICRHLANYLGWYDKKTRLMFLLWQYSENYLWRYDKRNAPVVFALTVFGKLFLMLLTSCGFTWSTYLWGHTHFAVLIWLNYVWLWLHFAVLIWLNHLWRHSLFAVSIWTLN